MSSPSPRPLLLRGGRLIDPSQKLDAVLDVLVVDGKVARIAAGLQQKDLPADTQVLDVPGHYVLPGLVDLHAHLREPGEEYKEDIGTGSASAAAGGFTAVCAMPNTKPTNDNRSITDLMIRRAKEVGGVRVYPVAAVTMGLKGEHLTEVGELKDAGAVALSDDGRPVMNSGIMRRALEYGRTFGMTVIQHAEDLHLSQGGSMNEGALSTRLGIRGQPAAAESVMVARDLALVELTGARYHVAHVSTKHTVQLLREAKAKGLPVTAEVTPHHLVLTDAACHEYDTHMKVNPPLRTDDDVAAVRKGLADGTIDAVATDHAPHSVLEKQVEFDCAAFGMLGFETAVPLVLGLVRENVLTLNQAVERLSTGPVRALGLPGGTLKEGSVADISVIHPGHKWQVDAASLQSKSKNSPFLGWDLEGKASVTVVGGKLVHNALEKLGPVRG